MKLLYILVCALSIIALDRVLADESNAPAQGTNVPVQAQKSTVAPLGEMLGSKFVDAQGQETVISNWEGTTVGIYFSAHWCPPCRQFTPVLVDFYNQLKSQGKKFQVIFASIDHDAKSMAKYMQDLKMPWLAYSFGDSKIGALKQKFGVQSIPTLIILNDKGEVITANGRGDVKKFGVKAFEQWTAEKPIK